MKVLITREVDPTAVEPGDHIADDGERFVVDEVSRRRDGIKFHGWPAHRVGAGRRSSVDAAQGERVMLLPDAATAARVVRTIVDTVSGANRASSVKRADVGVDAPPTLDVSLGQQTWRVSFVSEPGDVAHGGPDELIDGEVIDDGEVGAHEAGN